MINGAFFNNFLVKNLGFDEHKALITLNPTNNVFFICIMHFILIGRIINIIFIFKPIALILLSPSSQDLIKFTIPPSNSYLKVILAYYVLLNLSKTLHIILQFILFVK